MIMNDNLMNNDGGINTTQFIGMDALNELARVSTALDNSDKLSKDVINSAMFNYVISSCLDFQLWGCYIDSIFYLDKLVKSNVVTQDLFLDNVSDFITLGKENDGPFSDIENARTLFEKLPTLEVVKSKFNKSSQIKVERFIYLLIELIVKFDSKEFESLLNDAFFGVTTIPSEIQTGKKE